MPLVERAECLRHLEPLLVGTPSAFRNAVKRMRHAPPEDLIDRTSRSGSNLTRDYAVAELEKLWRDNSDVRTYTLGLLKLFVAKEMYLIRIKKLDRYSRSSNHSSGQDRRFRFQQPLPGIPRYIHLELGYVPNLLRTAVDDVQLVCLNGHRVYWSHSIENPSHNLYDLLQGMPDPNLQGPKPTPKQPDDGVSEPTVKIKPKK